MSTPPSGWRFQIQRYRGFSREAKLFIASVAFAGVGFSINWLMLNFYLESLGYGPTFVGWINSLNWLTVAVVGVPLGILSDRMPRKLGLVLGEICIGMGALGVALWSLPGTLIGFTVMAGVGFALVSANGSPFMAENSTPVQRTALFSAHAAIATATGFIGNLAGGQLPQVFAEILGTPPDELAPLRWTLVTVAGLQALAVAPLLKLPTDVPKHPHRGRRHAAPYPETPTAEPASVPQPSTHRWRLAHPKLFVKLLAPTAFVGLGAGLTMPFLNVFISGKFGIDFGNLGLLFGLSSLVTATGMLVQPMLADRFGKVRSVVVVQAVSLPFLLILGFAPHFPLVATAFLVRGMLMNMANPVYMAFCMEQIDERERATFSGANEVVWSLMWSISAAFSGWWRGQVGFSVGFNTEFGLMAVFYLLSTLLLFTLFGQSRQTAQSNGSPDHEQKTHP